MSAISLALSTSGSGGIGAIVRDLLPGRLRHFLPVARNREPVTDTSKEVGNESIEEMLFAISAALGPNLSNNVGEVHVQCISEEIPCPFGDWPTELWPPSLKNESQSHVED